MQGLETVGGGWALDEISASVEKTTSYNICVQDTGG